jgi:hypothetical protein
MRSHESSQRNEVTEFSEQFSIRQSSFHRGASNVSCSFRAVFATRSQTGSDFAGRC